MVVFLLLLLLFSTQDTDTSALPFSGFGGDFLVRMRGACILPGLPASALPGWGAVSCLRGQMAWTESFRPGWKRHTKSHDLRPGSELVTEVAVEKSQVPRTSFLPLAGPIKGLGNKARAFQEAMWDDWGFQAMLVFAFLRPL